MKIGIISDTHGSSAAFLKTIKVMGKCECIIHAGDILYHGPRNPLPEGYNPKELAETINQIDIPFIIARGNCDAQIDQMVLSIPIQSPFAFAWIANVRILVNHGHQHSVNQLLDLAEKWRIDLLVTGHTHIKLLQKMNGVILLNPGSCALPKDGIPSAAVLEDSKISLLDIQTGQIIEEYDLQFA
jgi:putative phosphoesterase